MKVCFAFFGPLCVLSSLLRADDLLLTSEPQMVSGTFADADPTDQPVAIWLERGNAMITSITTEETTSLLLIPAQTPTATACLLLGVSDASVTAISLRLKLSSTGGNPSPETLRWELAGVPFRLRGVSGGRWQIEFQAAQNIWVSLLANGGEMTSAVWHSLRMEFSAPSREFRLCWEEREMSPWFALEPQKLPLLTLSGGTQTDVWVDDISVISALPARATQGLDSDTTTIHIAALRKEIESSLQDLVRETGIVRRRLPRRHVSSLPALHSAGSSHLEVLTSLEGK